MVDDLPRVVLDAVDERGLAPPQHGKPERVQSRAVDDTAVVPQLALRVEHRDVEPPVAGAEARRPDDRRDLAAAQVELERGRGGHQSRCEALWGVELGVTPAGERPLVEAVEQPVHLEYREGGNTTPA